jgi:hypothetical protein
LLGCACVLAACASVFLFLGSAALTPYTRHIHHGLCTKIHMQ